MVEDRLLAERCHSMRRRNIISQIGFIISSFPLEINYNFYLTNYLDLHGEV